MSKRKQTKRRHSSEHKPKSTIASRRLPQPRETPPMIFANCQFTQEAADNPVVQAMTAEIHRVSRTSKLAPAVILNDWFKMMEAAMAAQAESVKCMALTGRVIEDPPEVAAIFQAARNRYRAATAHNPSVYRMMQESFIELYAVLMESSRNGLQAYPDGYNPDIVGQLFLNCLDYPTKWHRFFPDWQSCQKLAQSYLPDPEDIITSLCVEAALDVAITDGSQPELIPDVNWDDWWSRICNHLQRFIIGPEMIGYSSTMMLALALRFDTWAVQNHLVHFMWAGEEPRLNTLCHLNMMLYGLNGHFLEHIRMFEEIVEMQEQQRPDTQLTIPQPPPIPPPLEPPPQSGLALPANNPAPDRTFADLFRKN
ncbi:MAG: hypothetical protein AAF485_00215 [Chloroflexota bacterium]